VNVFKVDIPIFSLVVEDDMGSSFWVGDVCSFYCFDNWWDNIQSLSEKRRRTVVGGER
jgi:hypothetical protein